MTAVLALGAPDVPGLVTALGGTGEGFAAAPAPRAAEALDPAVAGPLLSLTASLLTWNECVIVFYPAATAGRAAPMLRMIRGALDTVAVVPVAIGMGPVGTSTLAAVVARLTETEAVTAGSLIAGAGWVERQLLSVAWLPTVAGLDAPAPTMADHLRSYLPGSAFAYQMAPERRLLRVGRGQEIPRPAWLGPRPVVALGGAAVLPGWVSGTLLPHLNPSVVLRVADGADVAEWWGTPKAVEVSAVPADVTPWAGELAYRFPASPCRWCNLASHTSPCPFCDLAEPSDATSGARPA